MPHSYARMAASTNLCSSTKSSSRTDEVNQYSQQPQSASTVGCTFGQQIVWQIPILSFRF